MSGDPNGIDCGRRPPPLRGCTNVQSVSLRSARTEVRIGFAIAYSDPSAFVRRLPDFGGRERDYPCERRALRKWPSARRIALAHRVVELRFSSLTGLSLLAQGSTKMAFGSEDCAGAQGSRTEVLIPNGIRTRSNARFRLRENGYKSRRMSS
jgi:hypothetical protein